MTCDKVLQQILDSAFIKFQNDCSTPLEAFKDSVIDFFSDGSGKDLFNLYFDFDFKCQSYLMSEFKKINNSYKFGMDSLNKISLPNKNYNDLIKERF